MAARFMSSKEHAMDLLDEETAAAAMTTMQKQPWALKFDESFETDRQFVSNTFIFHLQLSLFNFSIFPRNFAKIMLECLFSITKQHFRFCLVKIIT